MINIITPKINVYIPNNLYLLLVDTEYNITDKIEMEMLSVLSFQNSFFCVCRKVRK